MRLPVVLKVFAYKREIPGSNLQRTLSQKASRHSFNFFGRSAGAPLETLKHRLIDTHAPGHGFLAQAKQLSAKN